MLYSQWHLKLLSLVSVADWYALIYSGSTFVVMNVDAFHCYIQIPINYILTNCKVAAICWIITNELNLDQLVMIYFAMQDADQLLEKRVISRFSNRKLLFLPPSKEDIQRWNYYILTFPSNINYFSVVAVYIYILL